MSQLDAGTMNDDDASSREQKDSRRPSYRAEIASHVPGRLRVRLRHEGRHPRVMTKMRAELERKHGVRSVDLNQVAGSMTVHYDSTVHTDESIFDVFEDLDVIVSAAVGIPAVATAVERPTHSTTALTLADALDDLDQRIARVTGQTVDLRVLFPLGLAAAAAWTIFKRGLMLETLPGWLLLWAAFDVFVRLHPALAPSAQRTSE